MREPAGRVRNIAEWMGLARGIGSVWIAQSVTGASAAGPSSRRVWKQRRASLRAMGERGAGVGVVRAVLPKRVRECLALAAGLRQSTLALERLSPGNDDRIDLRSELADVSSVPNGFYRVCVRLFSAQIGQGHSSRRSSNV